MLWISACPDICSRKVVSSTSLHASCLLCELFSFCYISQENIKYFILVSMLTGKDGDCRWVFFKACDKVCVYIYFFQKHDTICNVLSRSRIWFSKKQTDVTMLSALIAYFNRTLLPQIISHYNYLRLFLVQSLFRWRVTPIIFACPNWVRDDLDYKRF